ncbi:unnamed protein product [Prorocentrum cordatum]|uniref:Uncharacterized protein n=1 Tax=Prorocentrum cordatum TaxID=2364126 RepID=A0ABN9WCK5_9DINO|nr:unnamed protein product [Polarella glacialis]
MSLERNMALLRSRELGASTKQPQHKQPSSLFGLKEGVVKHRPSISEEELDGFWRAPEAEPESATALQAAPASEPTRWVGAAVLALRARRPGGGHGVAEASPAAVGEPAAEPLADRAEAATGPPGRSPPESS